MATQPAIPAPSSPPPSSNYDMIGAALSEPSEPSQAAEPEKPAESAAEPTVETTPDSTKPETGESVEKPAETAAAEPEAEDNPYERDEDEEFKPQTLQEILRTKDGKRMLAHDKAMRALAKPPNPDGTGGIGFIPTIEQAREHYGSHRDLTLMEHDLSSGNPEQAERLLNHLFNPNRGESINTVAEQIIPVLAKTNPAALAQMIPQLEKLEAINPELFAGASIPFISRYSDALWDRFQAMPDPQKWEGSLKQSLYLAAQAINYDLTKQYRQVDGEAHQQARKEDDPLAQRAAELDAKAAQITSYEQQRQQAASQQWSSNFGRQVATELYSELDKALIPLKKMYEATPAKYERSRKFFHDQIVAEVPKNKQAWDIYQARVAQARRSGSPEQLDAATKEYVRLAQPAILAARKKFLEEEGVAIQKQSDARHSELRSIDSQKALNGGAAAAVTPNRGQSLQRVPGETAADFNLRQLRGS